MLDATMKGRQYNGQKKKDKWNQKKKPLHRKLKIEYHEPHEKPEVESGAPEGAPEGLAVPCFN